MTGAGGIGPLDVPPGTPERPEDLYEDAPCGLLSLHLDGTVVTVNRTLLRWTGHDRTTLVGRPLRELLAIGDRILYETHHAPLLRMQDEVRELAVTLVCPRGKLPVLLNSVLDRGPDGAPQGIRIAVFLAVDRRSYEAELLAARRRAEESEARVRLLARTLQNSLLPPRSRTCPGSTWVRSIGRRAAAMRSAATSTTSSPPHPTTGRWSSATSWARAWRRPP
jgi:PAS domain S-box-containing protein